MSMSNKSIFITGGSGYIGQHIIGQLLQDGYKVISLVRSESKANHLESLFQNSNLILEIIPDLGIENSLKFVFEKYSQTSTLIHSGAIINFESKDCENEILKPNLNLISNILTQIHNLPNGIKKFILTSSSASMVGPDKAFGIRGDYSDSDWSPLTYEMGKLNPNMAYFVMKKIVEEYVWKNQGNLTVVSICPSFVIGPVFDSKEIENFPSTTGFIGRLLDLDLESEIPEFAAGAVDIRDVAKVHSLAVEDEKFNNQRILLESEKAINQNMINLIKENFKQFENKLPSCDSVPKEYIGKPNDSNSKSIYKFELKSIDESVIDLTKQILTAEKK